MDMIAQKLHITDQHGWYKVKTSTLKKHGIPSWLVKHYKGSLTKLLASVYPEYRSYISLTVSFCIYNWDLTKFSAVPSGYWDSLPNQRTFLDDIAKKLNIKSESDWYQVRRNTLFEHGACGLLVHKYGGSRIKMLQTVYPEYPSHLSDHLMNSI